MTKSVTQHRSSMTDIYCAAPGCCKSESSSHHRSVGEVKVKTRALMLSLKQHVALNSVALLTNVGFSVQPTFDIYSYDLSAAVSSFVL